jgi:ectoine hydroxylase-related dioxygenase (phytanoyl-CoA dioxygenase family)
MTFIPGTHRRTDIRAVDLHDRTDFFEAAPEVTFLPRVTVPLRAGDCTFHHAYLAHTANPNDTNEFRCACVTIYVDAELTYDGRPHPAPTTWASRSVHRCRTRSPSAAPAGHARIEEPAQPLAAAGHARWRSDARALITADRASPRANRIPAACYGGTRLH